MGGSPGCAGGGKGRLRERLAANRTTQPLFDAPRLVRNLERAYRVLWDLHAAGQPPRAIVVREADGAE